MNLLHISTAGMVTLSDLKAAHEMLTAGVSTPAARITLIRHLIIELANVADLAAVSGKLYENDRELGMLIGPIRKGLEFFKYLRNQYVGHFSADLAEKTFEWQPYAFQLIGKTDAEQGAYLSWWALETAINTYTEPETGHKVFESETDLNYPPDNARFLNYLGATVLGAMTYLHRLIATATALVAVPDLKADGFALAKKAGETDFQVLTKGKR